MIPHWQAWPAWPGQVMEEVTSRAGGAPADRVRNTVLCSLWARSNPSMTGIRHLPAPETPTLQ